MAASWLPADHHFDLIYCANMLHISPWATCAALMRGSAQHLAPGRQLITYGPYLEDAVPTSPGNLAFDQSLRARNPAWGIRRREDVEAHMTALVNPSDIAGCKSRKCTDWSSVDTKQFECLVR